MLLKNKTAIIYGGGGAMGGAIAKVFAQEGARIFLAGRTASPMEAVAKEITDAGGTAEFAIVDALDQDAVEKHAAQVVQKAGRIDVSFNLIGMDAPQGAPLVEMSAPHFTQGINTAMTSHFITSTACARYMITQKSGVILALTANAGKMVFHNSGGFGVACAAIEALCRQLALELGSHGIRVVCLRSAGSPDAAGVREAFKLHATNAGMSFDDFLTMASSGTMLKHLPTTIEVANVAAFMASDRASGMTAAVENITSGLIPE
jgi:3-oxoacyl-[acyl-carrier protein] reductase